MPRKPRIEIAGGLYHVISRGNNRGKIFRSHEDYLRFTNILGQQKRKTPFFLYAYCLMPNHFHLLIEMQDEAVSRIMQRVLTTYSRYHNRKYKRIGHLFQGRYKSILCETDKYLGELVRYIHLNPVRAKMVKRPEEYEYSGHRAYIGLDDSGLVDTEPVLRHYGATRKRAVEVYRLFVESCLGQESQAEYYQATEGRLLGEEEFVKDVKHRIGEHVGPRGMRATVEVEDLLREAMRLSGLRREEVCGRSKHRETVAVRDAVIVVGRERGITNRELAEVLGVDPSSVTRRVDVARSRETESQNIVELRKSIERLSGE